MADRLTPEELKEIYETNNFDAYPPNVLLYDAKYNFHSLKSAPFFGEETLGIYPKIYEKLAERGYAPALYELGLLYYNGEWWLEQDHEKSADHHKKAAELGDKNAMFELYIYYNNGIGVEEDSTIALDWCFKAAEAGQHRACYNLGALYATGNGVELDEEKSMEWYKRSSEAGNGKASAVIGIMHKRGDGAPQDDEKAEEYFETAESQGFDVDDFLDMMEIDRY
jgi:uncharacterized protein